MRKLSAGSVAVFFSVPTLLANSMEPLRPFRADTPPVIDGKLDDNVWIHAPFVTGFKTWRPDFGKDMTEPTQAYFAYDRENLFFAFRCFDSEPDKIKTSITKRDTIFKDDWVAINLDSFNDQQSLYAFYINPMGIQADTRYAAGKEDLGFDLVWYSAGVVHDEGYTVEVRIPFKSIRFANTDPVEMGILFERHITRHSEAGSFPALKPERGEDFQTQMHPMIIDDVERYTLLELLPGLTHSRRNELNEEEELVKAGEQNDLSLTVKYGITPELIVDGTYNPDFSQVEADAGQVDVNLRAALFFPEKRPFFLEGSEYFNFAGPSQYDLLQAVVHTRNIIDPSTGVKVSGKIGKKNTIASTYARDESPVGDDPGSQADFAIFRYKRALREDSYTGVFYTGRERATGYNRVLGTDGQLRVNPSSTIGYHAFLSRTALDERSPPEDGHAVGANYIYRTRNLTLGLAGLDISEQFRTETGYLSREGVSRARLYLGPRLYPSGELIQRIDFEGATEHTRDKFSGIWEFHNFVSIGLVLPRSSNLTARYVHSTEVFLGEEFDTGGVKLSGESQLTKKFFFRLSARPRPSSIRPIPTRGRVRPYPRPSGTSRLTRSRPPWITRTRISLGRRTRSGFMTTRLPGAG
ncbi:MAG: DUF5916 domain-containing protein [Acidobacteriota bacterium]